MAWTSSDTRILRLLLEQPRTSVREYARILGVARGTLRPASTVSNATGDHRRGPSLSPAALGRGPRVLPCTSRSPRVIWPTSRTGSPGCRRSSRRTRSPAAGSARPRGGPRRRPPGGRGAAAQPAAGVVRTGPRSPCASGCRTGCCRWSRRSAGPRRRPRPRPGQGRSGVVVEAAPRRGADGAPDAARNALGARSAAPWGGGARRAGGAPRGRRARRDRGFSLALLAGAALACAAPPHGAGPGGPAPLIRLR